MLIIKITQSLPTLLLLFIFLSASLKRPINVHKTSIRQRCKMCKTKISVICILIFLVRSTQLKLFFRTWQIFFHHLCFLNKMAENNMQNRIHMKVNFSFGNVSLQFWPFWFLSVQCARVISLVSCILNVLSSIH